MRKSVWLLSILFSILFSLALAQSGPGIFQQNCSACHGENGQGRVGAFPPLAGHLPDLIKAPEGRTQILQTVLFGMQGEIRAKGQKYNGVMPAFGQLNDEQLAAVINHVLNAWGNDKLLPKDFKPITPAEVTAARATKLTPQQVGANRAKINVP